MVAKHDKATKHERNKCENVCVYAWMNPQYCNCMRCGRAIISLSVAVVHAFVLTDGKKKKAFTRCEEKTFFERHLSGMVFLKIRGEFCLSVWTEKDEKRCLEMGGRFIAQKQS